MTKPVSMKLCPSLSDFFPFSLRSTAFPLLVLLPFLTACNLDLSQPVGWDTQILTPLASSRIDLQDLINDTTLLGTDGENVLTLRLSDTLITVNLDDILRIPDTTLRFYFDLASFNLASQSFYQSLSLGQIARNFNGGEQLLAFHGYPLPIDLNLPNISTGPLPFDASAFFEYAKLTQGTMEIVIRNELPVRISNVQFQLRNQTGQELLIQDYFPILAQGDSVKRTYELGGKTFESALLAEISNMTVIGEQGTLVDTSASLDIRFKVSGLKAREARAIFPSQTVDSVLDELVYEFSAPYEDIRLTKAVLEQGKIEADVISTLEDRVGFFYSLPSVTKGGQVPAIEGLLEAAPPDGQYIYQQVEPMDGFVMDLTRNGRTFNTIEQFYKIDLIYSGKLVTIDLNDSLRLNVRIKDAIPAYVEGYFGRDTLKLSGKAEVDFLQTLNVSSLQLEKPEATLRFVNGLGMGFAADFNRLQARNTETGANMALQSDWLSSPAYIPPPPFQDTSQQTEVLFPLTNDNSNLKSFINLLPNEIEYQVDIDYNINGNPISLNNFASRNSRVYGILDLEIPLYGFVEGLWRQDTARLDFTSQNLENIQGGSLILQFDNRFPLEVMVDAAIFDDNGLMVFPLAEQAPIAPGEINPAGYVPAAQRSEIRAAFTPEQLEDIIALGKQIILRYRISSRPSGQPVKLYEDYFIDARIIGEFTYEVNR